MIRSLSRLAAPVWGGLLLLCVAHAALAQTTVLQGGPWVPGHAPMYVGPSGSQTVVQDSGTAAGGGSGVGLSELGVTARGTGTPPFAGQGLGPNGTNVCLYDGPTTSAYHYLCLSANIGAAGLITYGAGGTATALPLEFNINGSVVTVPTTGFGNVNGPAISSVGHLATWNNTTGSLLADAGTLTPGEPLVGAVSGGGITQGTTLGNTTSFATTETGGFTPGHCLQVDASLNIQDAGFACSSGTGSGTVTNSTANSIPYYPSNGTTVVGLPNANNSVLATSGSGVPSLTTQLPTGLSATNLVLTTPSLGVATGTSLSDSGAISGSQITATIATGNPPLVVSSTTNVPNLNASSLSGATFAAPGSIGSVTPGSGAFTSLSATQQIVSTQATGTAPLSVLSTTNVPNLNASSLNGATFASPGPIGSSVASTGAFTNLTASGSFGVTGILTSGGLSITNSQPISAQQFVSTAPIGTPPLVVTSTTNVPNLNASSLSGAVVGTSGSTIPLNNGSNTFSGANSFTGATSFSILQTLSAGMSITGGGETIVGGTALGAVANNGNGTLDAAGTITGTQLISNISTGTAPLVVTSTTNVANLNASSLGGATFASPGAIGSTSAGSGKFTTLGSSTGLSITGGAGIGVASGGVTAGAVANQGTGTISAAGVISSSSGLSITGTSSSLGTVTSATLSGSAIILGAFQSTFEQPSGTSYTLTVADCGKNLGFTSGSAVTVTLPNSLTACSLAITQLGAGSVALSAGVGATLNSRVCTTGPKAQYSTAALIETGNSGGTAAKYLLGGDCQ